MNTSYDHWVYSQLEPNDIIITGNAKRYKPVPVVYEPIPVVSEAEADERNDEYLEWVQQRNLITKK